jgi:Phage major capsid protein E
MSVWDVFNQEAFNVQSLTARVNNLPFVPGQISKSGLFSEQGVTTTSVLIEEQDTVLGLVAPSPRGGPGETTNKDGRRVRSFAVTHYERDDAVLADEVQNVRAFGSESLVETIQDVIDRKSRKHTIALDATLEHQRVGALKGLITDKNGNTIYNLATEFGVTIPSAVDFTLGTSGTKLRQIAMDIVTGIEDVLDGVPYQGVAGWCGKNFWKKFIDHDEVKKPYLNWTAAAQLAGLPLDQFEIFGINWQRYRTGSQATAALGIPYIGDNEVRFAPIGVPDLFVTYYGPADYEDTVNTVGLPRYARQYPMENGKGRKLEVQMNALSLCTRPKVLLSGTTSN